MAGFAVFRAKMSILFRVMAHGTFRDGVFSMIDMAVNAGHTGFVACAFRSDKTYHLFMAP